MRWEFDPNVRYVLGILRGFRIFYKNINDTSAPWVEKVINDPNANWSGLVGLKKYRDYSISIAAFTSMGWGAKSRPIILRTDEYGKW